MKKLLILACTLLLCASSMAGEEPEYTFVDWSPFGTNKPGWHFATGGFTLGWVKATGTPDEMRQDMGRSIEIGADMLAGARYVTPSLKQWFAVGVGINWRNYKLKKSSMFSHDADLLYVGAYPDGCEPQSSRLKIFSITMPMIFRQKLHGRWGVFVGPVVHFNVRASLETKYVDAADESIKISTHENLHATPVTVDLMAGVNFSALALYARYCPQRVIRDGYGPSFRTLTTGITFFF